MQILITGATGFLGTALGRRLAAEGHQVTGFGSRQCDLRIAGSLDAYNDRRYDRIYHLAAWTQAGDFCLYHPGQQWIINQQINTAVLEWWSRVQPQAKLISIGTSCSYDPDLPLAEENYLAGTPWHGLRTYAMTKRMLWVGQLALGQQFGLRHLCVVPSTLYGPDYPADGRQMHFIFDLIRKILRGKLYGEPVLLWGDGTQRRELVWRDDFIDALLALSAAGENEIINVGAGVDHSIREFATLICRLADFDTRRVDFDAGAYRGVAAKRLQTGKLSARLPGFAQLPLEEGLARVIGWFLERREQLLPRRPAEG